MKPRARIGRSPSLPLATFGVSCGIAVSMSACDPWVCEAATREPVMIEPPETIELITIDGLSITDAERRVPDEPARGPSSWPQPISTTVASPVFYDLDGDGVMEVIVACDPGALYVFDIDGTLRSGWPVNTGGSIMHPAVGDVDGDDVPEIFVGGYGFSPTRPQLFALTPSGSPKPGWPVDLPFNTILNSTCPVIADIDADNELEIGIASESGVSFFHSDGQPLEGWPFLWGASNFQWSAPAVGDVDEDGQLEIAVGNANIPTAGFYLLRSDGTVMTGWPKIISGTFNSPTLADLDGDGDLEIIANGGFGSTALNVWHHDGSDLAGWPVSIGNAERSNPAIADLDGDGSLEIVIATNEGRLHVLHADGTYLFGWPIVTGGSTVLASPTVIDVDSRRWQEIFLTYWQGFTHYVDAWEASGRRLPGFPKPLIKNTDFTEHASVHVADADDDGDLEIAAVGSLSFGGALLWVIPVDGSSWVPGVSKAEWPKIRRDAANTGRYLTNRAASVATSVAPAAPESFRIAPTVQRLGGTVRLSLNAATGGRLLLFGADGGRLGEYKVSELGGGIQELPVEALFDGRRARSGVFWLRWVPEGGGASKTTRMVLIR